MMENVVVYGAILFSVLIGIFIGWYLAYFAAAKIVLKDTQSRKHNTPSKPKDKLNQMEEEAVLTPPVEPDIDPADCEEIPQNSITERQESVSLTEFLCDANNLSEVEVIEKNREKSNLAYTYLARKQ